MQKNQLIKSSLLSLSIFGFVACGGGGGETSPTDNIPPGSGNITRSAGTSSLVDSTVDGIRYLNGDGKVHYTKDGGKFNYLADKKVEFFIGNLKIGELTSSKKPGTELFIAEIVGEEKTNINNTKVLNLARLVQSIDSDNNPDNGITIDQNIAEKFTTVENLSDIADFDTRIGIIDPSIVLVTKENAKLHLKEQVKKYSGIAVDETIPTLSNIIAYNNNIIISFSENMKKSTFLNSITLKDSNDIAVKFTYSVEGTKLTLQPSEPLGYQQKYTLSLNEKIKDLNDNSLVAFKQSITTVANTNTSEITVKLASTTSKVKIDESIVLQFSEKILPSALNSTNVVLKDHANNIVTTTLTYSESNNTLAIKANQELLFDSMYTIKLASSITNEAGDKKLSTNGDLTEISFTTASKIDFTKPQTTSITHEKEHSLSDKEKITILFSKEMNLESLNNIKITRDGSNVDYTLTYSGNTANLITTSQLLTGYEYLVTVPTSIKDTKGNFLDSSKEYKFTLIDEDRKAPTINSKNITSGQKDVSINGSFEIQFSEELNEQKLKEEGVISLKKETTNIPITISYANGKVTITPSTTLAYASEYVLSLTSNIVDLAGNRFDSTAFTAGNQDEIITFLTQSDTSDNISPTLVTNTSLGQVNKVDNIELVFSEELEDIKSSNIADYLTIPSGYIFESYSNKKITLRPLSNDYNASYTVTLKDTIKDLNGNTFANDVTVSFSTASQPDTSAPVVKNTIPISNGILSGLSTNLTITFNENLDASTVNATNIKLVKVSDETTNLLTNANISYSNPTITINPSSDLENNVAYKILIIYEGITDVSGNKFKGKKFLSQSNYEFSFTASSDVASCTSGYVEHDNKCYKIETSEVDYATAKLSCTLATRSEVESDTSSFTSTLSLDENKTYLISKDNNNDAAHKVFYDASFIGWKTQSFYGSGYPICKKN